MLGQLPQVGIGEIRRRNVRVNVVDRNKRNVVCIGERFCKVDPDQQRADQPRVRGHRNRADVRERYARCVKRFVGDTRDRFNVRTARNLGNNPAVEPVNLNLGRNDVGADSANPVAHFHHCGGGLVAGAFHS